MNTRISLFLGAAALASAVVFANEAGATPPAGRYTVSDLTVTDIKTKLVWQRTVPSATYTQADARAYCASVGAGAGANLGGAGWRLPTMKELQTIVDDSRTDPAIDTAAFPNTPARAFWSSSPVVGSPFYGWNVYFYNGSAYSVDGTNTFNVRCVR